MPYYCTVPRCTSMAGKAKNVSFHQFPRDEELASLWNKILKRGKPYTKYSKVCSLHFRPEDYTITSVGKNKGQWRTLRKDAIPSQNLPSESPVPTPHRSRSSGPWLPSHVPAVIDPMVQQQMAQAIYMQTMLAMQAANNGAQLPAQNVSPKLPTELNPPHTSNITISEIEQILQRNLPRNSLEVLQRSEHENEMKHENSSFKCQECSKCFKDPDVFILHRRTHTKSEKVPNLTVANEKENLNSNSDLKQETLRANPILANLLKSSISPINGTSESSNIFNTNNILSIENQIMTALAANLESYIRNLSSIMGQQKDESSNSYNDDNCHNSDSLQESDSRSKENVNDSCQNDQESDSCHDETDNCRNETDNCHNKTDNCHNEIDNCHKKEIVEENCQMETKVENLQDNEKEGSEIVDLEPNCDNEDLNESKDSNNLVIDDSTDYFPLHLHKKEIDQKH